MIELTEDTEKMIKWFYIWVGNEKKYLRKSVLEFNKIPSDSLTQDYSMDTIEIQVDVIIQELTRIMDNKRYFEHDRRLLLMLREYYYKNLEGLFKETKKTKSYEP